jgi:aryl-alcohol dehydrogenase-like predicted oxidoreductase
MQYRTLGTSNLSVSVVGLGTWAMGNDFWGPVDDDQSVRAIQEAVDNGINLIDTAPAYGAGHAEEVVGKAIQGRRDEVVVATKVGIIRTEDDFIRNLKPESMQREIDDSLRRLGVDTIDLYQIHWPDPDTPLESSMETLNKMQEQGKIRSIGVSNFNVKLLEQARTMGNVISVQPQFSLLHRKEESSLLPYCAKNNIGVLGYGSLAGGILTGKYREIPSLEEGDNRDQFYRFFQEPTWSKVQSLLDVLRAIAEERGVTVAQVAINWAIEQRGVTTALVGAKNPNQARTNAAAGEWSLSDEDLARINSAYDEHMKKSA